MCIHLFFESVVLLFSKHDTIAPKSSLSVTLCVVLNSGTGDGRSDAILCGGGAVALTRCVCLGSIIYIFCCRALFTGIFWRIAKNN